MGLLDPPKNRQGAPKAPFLNSEGRRRRSLTIMEGAQASKGEGTQAAEGAQSNSAVTWQQGKFKQRAHREITVEVVFLILESSAQVAPGGYHGTRVPPVGEEKGRRRQRKRGAEGEEKGAQKAKKMGAKGTPFPI